MYSLKRLKSMISKLNENSDSHIIKQLVIIVFKYLQERGRI